MFNPLTQAEVLKALGIPRQSFDQIRQIMIAEKDAKDIAENGHKPRYVFNGETLWRYQEYLEKRNALIEMQYPGWHSKRKHSLEDVQNLVDFGVLDGEVDHPAFQVANNSATPGA